MVDMSARGGKLRCGVDLVEVARIEQSVRNPRFLERVFAPCEIAYYESTGRRTQSLAGCFAAKEAFAKALGTGIRGFALNEVFVVHDKLGCPALGFSGKAASLAAESGLVFSLSITHDGGFAAAFVVALSA